MCSLTHINDGPLLHHNGIVSHVCTGVSFLEDEHAIRHLWLLICRGKKRKSGRFSNVWGQQGQHGPGGRLTVTRLTGNNVKVRQNILKEEGNKEIKREKEHHIGRE